MRISDPVGAGRSSLSMRLMGTGSTSMGLMSMFVMSVSLISMSLIGTSLRAISVMGMRPLGVSLMGTSLLVPLHPLDAFEEVHIRCLNLGERCLASRLLVGTLGIRWLRMCRIVWGEVPAPARHAS